MEIGVGTSRPDIRNNRAVSGETLRCPLLRALRMLLEMLSAAGGRGRF